jgi:outer membrane lipoprotein SlyB
MKTPSKVAMIPMTVALIGLGFSGLAQARDERARVISSTPAGRTGTGARSEVCQDQVVTVPGRKTGAGAVMGGIAGGAMGNAIGDGSGRAIATVIGLVGGAMIGDRIEGRPSRHHPGGAPVQHPARVGAAHRGLRRGLQVRRADLPHTHGRGTGTLDPGSVWQPVRATILAGRTPAHPVRWHRPRLPWCTSMYPPSRGRPGWRHHPHNRH